MPIQSPFKKIQKEFHQEDYRKVVLDKINSHNSINALFLLHGYVETYLRRYLQFNLPKDASKTQLKKINAHLNWMHLPNLAIAHLAMGTIGKEEHEKILQLNDLRNVITHEMISSDINDTEALARLNKMIHDFLPMCDILQSNYRKKFDEVSKEIVEQTKKDTPASKKSV